MAISHEAKMKRATHAAQSPEQLPLERVETEHLTRDIGLDLLRHAREHRSSLLSSRYWSDRVMAWAMHDPAFKVQLFRFVDVFPMLRTSQQVHDYLAEYLNQPGVTLPSWIELGLRAGGLAKCASSSTSSSAPVTAL